MVRSTNENLEEVPDGGESVGLNEAIAGPSYPMHPIPNGGHPIAGSSNGPAIRSRRAVHIRTPENRLTYRKLRPIHLFMITINGTLGTGLYWRGGQALELGGPLALILAFLLVGFLAWAVMQCISEMLCIWPVPSALSVFVRKFVDEELGIAVGIAYWFTYSAGFAALIAAAAAEMKYWQNLNYPQSVFLYLLLPILLVIINSFGIELYGWIEVTTGIIKSTFLFIILVATIALVKRSGNAEAYWNNSVEYDTSAATNWFSAFCLCLSTAIFTYIGVEIPAASALEARGQGDERSTSPERTDGNGSDLNAAPRTQTRAESIGATIIYSAKRTSMIAFIVYFISAILISVAIDRGNCSLPRPGWLASSSECQEHSQNGPNSTSSVFVIVAAEGGEAGLADAFNGFLIFTAITCANTNLYVASRTLFGLANQVDGGRNQGFWANIVASFGRTNKYRVPVRAMSLSAFAFSWVPFLNLASVDAQTYASDAINTFVNILSQMTSVSALIVWACECWAFIRFFHHLQLYKDRLKDEGGQLLPRVQRWRYGQDDDYPYRSHAQPVLAYTAFIGCLFILIIGNGASLWQVGFKAESFLSSYLLIILFAITVVALKLLRQTRWRIVELSEANFLRIITELHDFPHTGIGVNPNISTVGSKPWLWPLPLIMKSFGGSQEQTEGERSG